MSSDADRNQSAGFAPLVGHQVTVHVSGTPVLTLADLWPVACRAAVVGVNPAPASVSAGHYYQGSDGRRAVARLRDVGLWPPSAGGYADDEALAAGIGFTDVVKRPTGRSRELSRHELEVGRRRLQGVLREHSVPLVVCVFKPAVEALLGEANAPGFQPQSFAGAPVFRMPGPYMPREAAQAAMATLADVVGVT